MQSEAVLKGGRDPQKSVSVSREISHSVESHAGVLLPHSYPEIKCCDLLVLVFACPPRVETCDSHPLWSSYAPTGWSEGWNTNLTPRREHRLLDADSSGFVRDSEIGDSA